MSNTNYLPFFKFQDDQDAISESEIESNTPPPAKQDVKEEEEEEEEEQKQEQSQLNHKKIDVKGGIAEDQPNDEVKKIGEEKGKDEEKENEFKINKQPIKKYSFTQKAIRGFISIILQLFFNITILYPLLFLFGAINLLLAFIQICCPEGTFMIYVGMILFVTISSSILFVCYETFNVIFQGKDDICSIWYLDSFILFFTRIMIFSMIQITKQDSFELKWLNLCTFVQSNNLDALIFTVEQKSNQICDVIIDISCSAIEWKNQYKAIINNKFELELNSQRFNTFINKLRHPDILQYIGYQFILDFQKELKPTKIQYLTLSFIMLLKIISLTYYLHLHSKLSDSDILNVVIITVLSFNEVYCLNFMLSNYDLRRKTLMCQNINSAILISGKIVDYEKIIDITNSESIETWDNTRRCVYEFFSEMQKSLELNYICLFLYYLIVTNIILAAYGEIYLIISKESFLLNPLIVISSTFTFILLNTLIFFRLYFGQKYNDTFEESEDSVDNIIGIYQDLIQMYDYNFTQRGITKLDYLNLLKHEEDQKEQKVVRISKKPDEANKSQNYDELKNNTSVSESRQLDEELCVAQLSENRNQYTCYHIMISKFMFLSDYYIQKGLEFQGKVYSKAEEKSLQQRMMHNCLKSFRRIKQQIVIDAKLQCYQAFNIVKLDFKDTLFTISLGLITLLPQIIPKFIEQFKIIDESKPV